MPSANTVPSPIKINDMTVAELHQLIKKEKNMPVFIDVREPNEIEAQGKISGATNIPFGLTKTDPSLFNAALREIIPNKEDKLIISCRSGRRSLFAAEYLVDNLGYSNIYNVAGGILDWIDHQYPVQAYSNNHSPWVHSFTSNHPYYAVIDLASRDTLIVNPPNLCIEKNLTYLIQFITDHNLNVTHVFHTGSKSFDNINHPLLSQVQHIHTTSNPHKEWKLGTHIACNTVGTQTILAGDALIGNEQPIHLAVDTRRYNL